MSGTDPFFDAWVRDKLLHTEARTPEHLWEKIRKRSRHYVIMERNKYLLILLLLLGSTAGTGYWIFRPTLQSGLTGEKMAAAPTSAMTPGAMTSGTIASGAMTSGTMSSGTIASGAMTSGTPASAAASTPAMMSHEMTPAMSSDVSANTAMVPGNRKADGGAAYGDPTNENATAATNRLSTDAPPTEGPTIDAPASTYDLANASANDNLRDDLQAIAPFPLTPAPPRITADARTSVAPTSTLIRVRPANHAYFEAYAGPDHVNHYITSSGHAYNGFVTQMRGAIQSFPSFSIGARVDLPVVRDNWRLQLGLHYAQINEKMTYSNFNATKAVTQVSTRSITQPGGGTMVLRDTSTVLVKGQIFKQSLNAYRMFDIPVLISHTVIKTGQVQVNGSVGALFNVTSWYNGDVLDTTGLPVSIDTKTTQGTGAWKKHIGTSLYGSLSLYDQIFSRVQATFEPYLRYDLTPINRDLSVYKERFVTTGLMLGIRYQLGK